MAVLVVISKMARLTIWARTSWTLKSIIDWPRYRAARGQIMTLDCGDTEWLADTRLRGLCIGFVDI